MEDERALQSVLLAVLAFAVSATTAVAANGRNGNGGPRAGECGGYKYWEDGECLDARQKKSGKSWQQESLGKQWKP